MKERIQNSKFKIQNWPSACNYDNNVGFSILYHCIFFVRDIAENISVRQSNNFEF